MKKTPLLLTVFSVVAFTVGCKPTTNDPATPVPSTQLEDMKKETKEAAAATKDYAYAQKAEFVAAMKAQMAALNKEIDEFGTKVENSSDSAKEEAKRKLQAMRDKTAELNTKLDSMGDATESTWDNVKTSFKNGYGEVKESVNDGRQWLSDKIAPK